ncbi:hypothetical protein D7Y04_43405, partial [Corallococcus sp. AB038B]
MAPAPRSSPDSSGTGISADGEAGSSEDADSALAGSSEDPASGDSAASAGWGAGSSAGGAGSSAGSSTAFIWREGPGRCGEGGGA